MPRAMSSDMLTALAASVLIPAVFVQITFANETLYLWGGVGSISWNSHTWSGVGSFGGLSTIEDGTNVEARGIVLTLSGIDSVNLAEALQNIQVGLPVVVYLALFQSDRTTLVADPLTAWSGRVDQPTFDISGAESTITLNCESRLLDMNVALDRRYTLEDSQMDNPGDLGFQFVNALQEINILWGSQSSSANNV